MSQPQTPSLPELKKTLFEIIERLPIQLKYEKVQAQITRARFNALMSQGFTAEQALYLCKSTT